MTTEDYLQYGRCFLCSKKGGTGAYRKPSPLVVVCPEPDCEQYRFCSAECMTAHSLQHIASIRLDEHAFLAQIESLNIENATLLNNKKHLAEEVNRLGTLCASVAVCADHTTAREVVGDCCLVCDKIKMVEELRLIAEHSVGAIKDDGRKVAAKMRAGAGAVLKDIG